MSNFKKDILHENEDKSDVRLNRFLSDAGFCSRREADRLICLHSHVIYPF